MRLALLGLALVCAACGSDDGGEEKTATPSGTTVLKFSVTNTVKQSPGLVDPLSGATYGALYRSEEVTLTGPIDGAEQLASVELTGVDLTTADESTGSWTSPPLPVGTITFLGFFDVDGNGSETRDPEPGDPVTLPVTNKIEIKDGQETPFTVKFDLVYN
jgi:hypothetical protein